ncbi:MAG: hypothetical protein Q4G68_12055 [Planctomycetia bacterium]|nr:hypothetical protein [Planctomycetia bacterium]
MSIRVICPHCKCKIDASDTLANKLKPCPKCKNQILIAPSVEESPKIVPVPHSGSVANAEAEIEFDPNAGVSVGQRLIRRLKPGNIYVITSYERIVAYWKFPDGWLYNVGSGFVPAKRNRELIPENGTFTLIEGNVHKTEEGQRLVGLQFYELKSRGVLLLIAGTETDILEKVTERSACPDSAKRFFLQYIRGHYFTDFTKEAPELVDFLLGDDYHTRQIGDTDAQDPQLG